MHWLTTAAARAGLSGASTLLVATHARPAEAWDAVARGLGVSHSELARSVAPALHVGVANLAAANARAARLVPERMARRFEVFPLREDDRQLVIATADPGNLECEQTLAFASGRRVVFELAPPAAINEAIGRAYSGDRSMDAVLAGLDADVADAVRVLDDARPDPVSARELESAPVVQLTNLILREAVHGRASDVHIEPAEGGGTVRFRVDGVMRQHMHLPMAALNRVVSRIKVLSRLDIADRVRPQDGRARVEIDHVAYDLRVSTVPIRDAEKAVIRVLRPDRSATLESIGSAPAELTRLRRLLAHRDGIVLVTGPTGSGKTSTLYAALRELARGDVNITTVEDPVEYELPGLAQIQVDPRRGVTFGSALRAVLRQDPDVIFVGEIRDLETAEIAVQAAMTGHLVLATLHTNDAVSAVARLLDLGLDRPSIAATLRGVLAQRLVRRVCEQCAAPITGGSSPADDARMSATSRVPGTVRAVGCERCGQSGYYGRAPVQEVFVLTPEIAEQVSNGASTHALQRAAVAGGMRTMREAAADRARQGETTLDEVERVLGELASTDSPAAGPPMILVADDDPVERMLVTATLEKGGFRVTAMSDGAEAVERLHAGSECALVITDLQMRRMDGDELIRVLRGDPRTAALPAIVLTGTTDASRESEIIELGADDYLRKPVDPPLLLARVRAALRRAAA